MENNINFIGNAKENCFIEDTVVIGENVTIYPNNTILGGSEIKDNVVLFPNNIIIDSKVCEGVVVTSSVIEQSTVCENSRIGPFSHLRPNSIIKQNAKIGNFVEIKNSTISENTKVSHLSYVGDAFVGKNVNIGCGVVFVNFNGKTKSKSVVKDGSFVGSSVNIIAPVTIGEKSFVCAGTTVDKDIPDESFAIGRSRVQIKPERAKNYLKKE